MAGPKEIVIPIWPGRFHGASRGLGCTASVSPVTLSLHLVEAVPQEGQNKRTVSTEYKPIHTSLLCQPFFPRAVDGMYMRYKSASAGAFPIETASTSRVHMYVVLKVDTWCMLQTGARICCVDDVLSSAHWTRFRAVQALIVCTSCMYLSIVLLIKSSVGYSRGS